MYEDKDPWPFKCPECGEEFTEEIGGLKAQTGYEISVKCPGIVKSARSHPLPEYSPVQCRRVSSGTC